jgi:hypothetical protein
VIAASGIFAAFGAADDPPFAEPEHAVSAPVTATSAATAAIDVRARARTLT